MLPVTQKITTSSDDNSTPQNPYLKMRALLQKLGILDRVAELKEFTLPPLDPDEKELLIAHYKSPIHYKGATFSILSLYEKLIEKCDPIEIFHCGSGPFKILAPTYFPRVIQSAYKHLHGDDLKLTPDLKEVLIGIYHLYCEKTDDDFRNYYSDKIKRPALNAHNFYCEYFASLLKTTPLDVQRTGFSKLHHPSDDDLNRISIHTVEYVDFIDVIESIRNRILEKGAGKVSAKPLLQEDLTVEIYPTSYHKNPWIFLFEIMTGTITHAETQKENPSKRIYEFHDLLKFSGEIVKGLTPRHPETAHTLATVFLANKEIDATKEAKKFLKDHLPQSPNTAAAFVLQCSYFLMDINPEKVKTFYGSLRPLYDKSILNPYLEEPLPVLFAFLTVKGWLDGADVFKADGHPLIQIRLSDEKFSYITLPFDLKKSLLILEQNPHLLRSYFKKEDMLTFATDLAKSPDPRAIPVVKTFAAIALTPPFDSEKTLHLFKNFYGTDSFQHVLQALAQSYVQGSFTPSPELDKKSLSTISRIIGVLVTGGQHKEAIQLFQETILPSPLATTGKIKILKQMGRAGVQLPKTLLTDLHQHIRCDEDIALYISLLKLSFSPSDVLELLKPLIESFRYSPSKVMADAVCQYCHESFEADDKLSQFWLFCLQHSLWTVIERSLPQYVSMVGALFRACYQDCENNLEILKELKDELEEREALSEKKLIAPLQAQSIKEHPDLKDHPLHTFCLSIKQKQLLAIRRYIDEEKWEDALAITAKFKNVEKKLICHLEAKIRENPRKGALLHECANFFTTYKKAKCSPALILKDILLLLDQEKELKSARKILQALLKHMSESEIDLELSSSVMTILNQSELSDFDPTFEERLTPFVGAMISHLTLEQMAPLARLHLLKQMSGNGVTAIFKLCRKQVADSPFLVDSIMTRLPKSDAYVAQVLCDDYLQNENVQRALHWLEETNGDQETLSHLIAQSASDLLTCPASFYNRCLALATSESIFQQIIQKLSQSTLSKNLSKELELLTNLYHVTDRSEKLDARFISLIIRISEEGIELTEADKKRVITILESLIEYKQGIFKSKLPPLTETRKLIGGEFSRDPESVAVETVVNYLPAALPEQRAHLIAEFLALSPSKITLHALRIILSTAKSCSFKNPLHIARMAQHQLNCYDGPENEDSILVSAYCSALYLQKTTPESVRSACSLLAKCFSFSDRLSSVKPSFLLSLYDQWLKSVISTQIDMENFERGTLLVSLTQKISPSQLNGIQRIIRTVTSLQLYCLKSSVVLQVQHIQHVLEQRQINQGSREAKTLTPLVINAIATALENPKFPMNALNALTKYPHIVDYLKADKQILSLFILQMTYTQDENVLTQIPSLIKRTFEPRTPFLCRDWERAVKLQRARLNKDRDGMDSEIKFFIKNYINNEKARHHKSILEVGIVPEITDHLFKQSDLTTYETFVSYMLDGDREAFKTLPKRLYELIGKMTGSLLLRSVAEQVPDFQKLLTLLTDRLYKELANSETITEKMGSIAVDLAVTTITCGDIPLIKLFRFSRFCSILSRISTTSPSYKQMLFLQMYFENQLTIAPSLSNDDLFALIIKFIRHPTEYGFSCAITFFNNAAINNKCQSPDLYKRRCRELYENRFLTPLTSLEFKLDTFFESQDRFIPYLFRIRFTDLADTFYDIFLDQPDPEPFYATTYGTLILAFYNNKKERKLFFSHLKKFSELKIECDNAALLNGLQISTNLYLSQGHPLDRETVSAVIPFLEILLLVRKEFINWDQWLQNLLNGLKKMDNFAEFESEFKQFMCYTWNTKQLKEMGVSFSIPEAQKALCVRLAESASSTSTVTLLKLHSLITDYPSADVDSLLNDVVPLLSATHQKEPIFQPEDSSYARRFGRLLSDTMSDTILEYQTPDPLSIIATILLIMEKELTLTSGDTHLYTNLTTYFSFIIHSCIANLKPKANDCFFRHIKKALSLQFKRESYLFIRSDKDITTEVLIGTGLCYTLLTPPNPDKVYYEDLYQCFRELLIEAEHHEEIYEIAIKQTFSAIRSHLLKMVPEEFKSDSYHQLIAFIDKLCAAPEGPKIPFKVKIREISSNTNPSM